MISTSITVSGTLNALSAAVSLAAFAFNGPVSAQLQSTAIVGDGVQFYGADVSGLTSTAQMTQIENLVIGGQSPTTGQQPSTAAPVLFLYVYAVRTGVGTPGALTATLVGQEPNTGGGSGNPNAILQGGNAFGAEIDIGPTDGHGLVIGAGGAFGASNTTSLTLDTTTIGPIAIGTSAFAKAITVGNTTSTTGIQINAGTGGITANLGGVGAINVGTSGFATTLNVGTGAAAYTATFGSTNTTSTTKVQFGTGGLGVGVAAPGTSGITIDTPSAAAILVGNTNATSLSLGGATGGALTSLTMNVAAGGSIAIATASNAATINVGTGGAVINTTIGSTTGASITAIQGGTGTSSFNVTAGGTLTLGGANVACTVNLATGTGGKTVHIADAAAANIVFVGSSNTTSATTVLGGSGGIGVGVAAPGGSATTVDAPVASGSLNLGTANATTITMGGGAAATIGIGPTIATVITIGNTVGATSVTALGGTGGIGIGVAAAGSSSVTIDTTGAHTVFVGNTNATAVTVGNATALIRFGGVATNTVVALADQSLGGTISAANVNASNFITIAQTTAGQAWAIAAPTGAAAVSGRVLYVTNIGSVSFTLLGKTVAASAASSQSLLVATWDNTNTRWVTTI